MRGPAIARQVPGGAALLLATLALAGLAACRPPVPEVDQDAFRRFSNLGRAHLENREAAAAVAAFEAAVAADPASAPALRNLARAQLLAREHEAALATLQRVRQVDEGESAATAYLEGLALARLSRFDEAIAPFTTAVHLDPASAPLRYQLANAYQAAGRHPEAEEQLRETARLDPLHATATFRLARYATSRGDRREAAEWNRRFSHLRRVLGDAGRSADELEVSAYSRAELPAPAAQEAREAQEALALRVTAAGAAATAAAAGAVRAAVVEVDADGRPLLFTVDRDGALALLAWEGDALAAVPAGRLATPIGGGPVAVGSYRDEAPAGERFDPGAHTFNDVYLPAAGGGVLLRRLAGGGFADATAEAGLGGVGGERAAWADLEHDGDLDLLIAGAAGLTAWENDGDGAFVPAGEAIGAAVSGAAHDVAAADLDEDVAVDLVVARPAGTVLLAGQRAGRFAARASPPDPLPPARRVLLDDLDGDGSGDLALAGEEGIAILYPARGRRRDLAVGAPVAALVRLDVDNDGRLDLAAAGGAPERGWVRLWRNDGEAGWREVSEETGLAGLALGPLADLVAADLDADGDDDLLAVSAAGGLHLLRNDGGNARPQLKVRLRGTKTNPSGIGTRLEVIAGGFAVTRLVDGPVLDIGLGAPRHLDAVRTVWTNGVVDNQIDLDPPAGPLTVVEKNVATGSCPFLYAWDGRGFRFVTDLLGNSPVGLPLSRETMLPADPEELVLIGGETGLAPRDGAYLLEVTSEFREVLYLDAVELLAVDHPPGVEVHSPDKLGPPPYPPSRPWALARLRPPRSARGDDGVDRTAAVRAADGDFAPPGRALPPPYRGITEPLALTLDFDPLDGGALDGGRPLVLALTGWLQYGDASTNIALSQGARPRALPPRLEAESAAGWRPLPVTVGMPAGKTKTILVDLAGALPAGTRRLRLVTHHEIRWDRIALGERLPDAALVTHVLPPATAELRFRGFSELRARAPGHPTTPDYGRVRAQPPWRTVLTGWSTRFGEVGELVAARDGRLAIVNSGDALRLAFDAPALPPPTAGTERTFALRSVGWDKDGDHNVTGGDRVEPLPEAADGDDGWRHRYNTRWVPADLFSTSGPR